MDDAPPRDRLTRAEIRAGPEVLDIATRTRQRRAARQPRPAPQVVGPACSPELLAAARLRADPHAMSVDWFEW